MTLELGQTSENWRFSFHYDSVGLCCGFVVLLINYLPIAHNTWKIKNTSVAQQQPKQKSALVFVGLKKLFEMIPVTLWSTALYLGLADGLSCLSWSDVRTQHLVTSANTTLPSSLTTVSSCLSNVSPMNSTQTDRD